MSKPYVSLFMCTQDKTGHLVPDMSLELYLLNVGQNLLLVEVIDGRGDGDEVPLCSMDATNEKEQSWTKFPYNFHYGHNISNNRANVCDLSGS
jgi:hypothetical protein